MPLLQFNPLASLVEPAFWHELTNVKIDIQRLSDDTLPISGSYSIGRVVVDRETQAEVGLGCNFSLGPDAFRNSTVHSGSTGLGPVGLTGVLKNYNTIEEFKAADKVALFNHEADQLWSQIHTTKSTANLNRFLLLTYADLKKYKYYYWFAFPALVAKPAWEITDAGWRNAKDAYTTEALSAVFSQLKARTTSSPFFLVRTKGTVVEIAPVEEYDAFFDGIPSTDRTIAFIDPSPTHTTPGWPLRNLLAYLRAIHPASTTNLRILRWMDSVEPTTTATWRSLIGDLSVSPGVETLAARPSAVGWEKNPQGKLGPRVADLAPMMDPTRLATQALNLNLKLMRWRILPALDLEKVASTKCLLLGAGTLGCYVARGLMAWGIEQITLVDSGRVSFSNPVRQPLFEFEDCLNGGKPKAECAAAALKRIWGGVKATGHTMSIPMPGHPIPPTGVAQAQTRADVKKLEELIDEHDVVYLLMDSRESRWLPTVIATAKGKLVMNAALGFDTFLVMRHGPRAGKKGKANTTAASAHGQRLGCYYCNDIVAPADSLTDRTLDQMCTVTRPGIASIASSTAVELMVSVLQHPDGIHAPAPPPQVGNNTYADPTESGSSILGLVPHQLRGFLAQFRNMHIVGAAYDRCTGCSETVLTAYETHGFDMLLRAFNEPKYLEELTGLDKLYDEGEAALESVDWDEDDEDGFE